MDRLSTNPDFFYVSGDGTLPSLKRIMDRPASSYSDEDMNGPAATITMMTNFLEEAVAAADNESNNNNNANNCKPNKISMISATHPKSQATTTGRLDPTNNNNNNSRLTPNSFSNICQGLGLSTQVNNMEIDGDASYATLTPLQPLTTISESFVNDRFVSDIQNYPQNVLLSNPINEQLLLDFQKVQQQLIAHNNSDLSALYNQISSHSTTPPNKLDYGIGISYEDVLSHKAVKNMIESTGILEGGDKQFSGNISDFVTDPSDRFGAYQNIHQIAPFLAAENIRYLNENFPSPDNDPKDKGNVIGHPFLLNSSNPSNVQGGGGKSHNILDTINSSTYQLLNNSGGSNFTPLNLMESYQYEKLAALGLNFPYSNITRTNELGLQPEDMGLRYQSLNSSALASNSDLKTAIEIDHFNYIQHHLQLQNVSANTAASQNGLLPNSHLLYPHLFNSQDKDLETNQLLMMAQEMEHLPSSHNSNGQVVSLDDIVNSHQMLLANTDPSHQSDFCNQYNLVQKGNLDGGVSNGSISSNVLIHHHGGLQTHDHVPFQISALNGSESSYNNNGSTPLTLSLTSLGTDLKLKSEEQRYHHNHHQELMLQAQLYHDTLSGDLQKQSNPSHSPTKAQLLGNEPTTLDLSELGLMDQQQRLGINDRAAMAIGGGIGNSNNKASTGNVPPSHVINGSGGEGKLPNIVVIKNDMVESMKKNLKKVHLLQNASNNGSHNPGSANGASPSLGNLFSYGGTSNNNNTFFNLSNMTHHLSSVVAAAAAEFDVSASSTVIGGVSTAAVEAAILSNAMRSFGGHHHSLPQPLLLESSSITSSPACSPCSTPTLPPSALIRPGCIMGGGDSDNSNFQTVIVSAPSSSQHANHTSSPRKSRSHHAKGAGGSKNQRQQVSSKAISSVHGIVEEDGIVAMSPDDAILDIKPAHGRSSHSASHNGSGAGDELEEINTKDLAQRISSELKRYSIPQAVFAQRVLCRSQGTLSDLLRNPKPWSKLKSGRETFRRMSKWLDEPEFQRMSSLRLAGKMNVKRGPPNCLDPDTGLDTKTAGPTSANNISGDHLRSESNSTPVSYVPIPIPNNTISAIGKVDANNLRNKAKKKEEKEFQMLHGQIQQQQQQQLLNQSNVASSESSSNSSNGHKKPRLVFTDIQRRTLQAIFKETKRPSKEMQSTIAQQLGLDLSTVGNFFMNARRRSLDKWRDDRCSSSTGSVCCHSNMADDEYDEPDAPYDNDEDVKMAAAAAELVNAACDETDDAMMAYSHHHHHHHHRMEGRAADEEDDDEVYTCQMNDANTTTVSGNAVNVIRMASSSSGGSSNHGNGGVGKDGVRRGGNNSSTGGGGHQGGRVTRSRAHKTTAHGRGCSDYYGDATLVGKSLLSSYGNGNGGGNGMGRRRCADEDDSQLEIGVVSSTTTIESSQQQQQQELPLRHEELYGDEVLVEAGGRMMSSTKEEVRDYYLDGVAEITEATMEAVNVSTNLNSTTDEDEACGEDGGGRCKIEVDILAEGAPTLNAAQEEQHQNQNQMNGYNNGGGGNHRTTAIEMTY